MQNTETHSHKLVSRLCTLPSVSTRIPDEASRFPIDTEALHEEYKASLAALLASNSGTRLPTSS